MCGIVGYIGHKNATSILLDGLKRLEYRGYDSSGVALLENGDFQIIKEKGKIVEIEKILSKKKIHSSIGIAHTRWATHGEPSKVNAHPHLSSDKRIVLVHNGIIENYRILKRNLEAKGFKFVSDTDSEVLANLIAYYYQKDLEEAVRRALKDINGTYGILVIAKDNPNLIVGARHGSPIVVGIGENEMFVASDVSAIVTYTKSVIYLDDNEIVAVTKNEYRTTSLSAYTIEKDIQEIDWDIDDITKGGFEHYMLKEIHDQVDTIQNAFRGRLNWDEATAKLGGIPEEVFLTTERVIITACGTSYYSALVGEYLLEDLAEIPTEV
ncbi:MAG: isomerizing glutamine--fructose-6-phosphate transaminase [Leptospiraceae bacterium]|nr:isomerizing glutamine--fructose-6-phosphate transaminase [Leptospiraceae bacterium]